jgi:methionine sulfoxide reductase heme-binding subunit
MPDMLLWELTRASAFVAFGCYTLVVAWGILLSARSWKPAAAQFVYHRFLSALGLVAVATHLVTLMLDHYAKVGPATMIGRDDRPGVILGVAAFWLGVALPISFRLKQAKWMSQKAWRALHYMGYAMWALIAAHGIAEGTDTGATWALGTYAVSAALIGATVWWRWVDKRRATRPRSRPAVAGASADTT